MLRDSLLFFMNNPIIEFNNFSFKYRSQVDPTLMDINLKIYPGEKVLIAGVSGCGKSTLLKSINGLIPSTFEGTVTGTVNVCGLNPSAEEISGMSKHVGTVLQDTDGQFIGLTVAEDIAFALENDNVPVEKMRSKVMETANLVEVDDLLDSVPAALSGGQKQRVSLAGILVDDVEVLLFDEPLANLDPASGKKIIKLIDSLNEETGKTIIIVEHRIEDVLYKDVDRIILMEKGRIIADEKPEEILCKDTLKKCGLREPLYIAALKHAGCSIEPADNPQNIEEMNLLPYRHEVQSWFQKIQLPPKVKSEETVLELKGVCFSYDKKVSNTLENINFIIKKGEMTSIVGTNGAGKSTLASLICGFLKEDEGNILVNGNDISKLTIKQRAELVGFVMQNQNQMISQTIVFDEVALGLKVRKIPKDQIKERVNEILKTCGIYQFRNWPINALSHGQKKRVTIASILVLNPKILILDEPTASQDYNHYTEIMEFLRKLNREQNITILMITHDMHLMLDYTDRALVFSKGHLIADDTSASILTNQEITEAASLKQTSLYNLAVRCNIDQPTAFVDRFIHYERENR